MLASYGAYYSPVATTYMRVQGSGKQRLVRYLDAEGGLHEYDDEWGFYPKTRRVQATGFVFNFRLSPVSNVITEVVKTMDVGALTPFDTVLEDSRTRPDVYGLANDFSEYDDSIGSETLLVFIDEIWKPSCLALQRRGYLTKQEVDFTIDLLSRSLFLPLLMPPVKRDEAARLVQRHGGIPSGIRPTSLMGTLINLAIRAWQRDQVRVPSSFVRTYAFGDDSLLLVKRDWEKRLVSAPLPPGLNETTPPDVTYLMKRIPTGYGYLGRMVMSTIQKEARNEPKNGMIAALGVAARRIILQGHPLAQEYDNWLKMMGGRYAEALELARLQGPGRLARVVVIAALSDPNPSAGYLDSLTEILDNLGEMKLATLIQSQGTYTWEQLNDLASTYTHRKAHAFFQGRKGETP
jgi:hypothetical protein